MSFTTFPAERSTFAGRIGAGNWPEVPCSGTWARYFRPHFRGAEAR
ncbi:hypothetical protein HNQ92_004363 [Rhabdobacter roseus]|uniref:Uncharacterized protein n=1 Tax=Rhabdobacter roseus TaxID=1655419 RepID=A0A840TY37_9BACT|nr:hypothetical protein [Rhabdobacter roseus]MBB5286203.1 hypothetical protein [Rhabdobacter roseus]